MTLKLVTAPATEPLTVAECKAHCEITASDWDSWFNTAIPAARMLAEHQTGRALIVQTWDQWLDSFRDSQGVALGSIPLMAPAVSITTFTYIDTAGDQQVLAETTDYVLDTARDPGYVVPAYGTSWPDTYATINAVRVRFVAGYANAAAVPAAIRHWMLMQIAAMFAHREAFTAAAATMPAELPNRFVDALLDPYRTYT